MTDVLLEPLAQTREQDSRRFFHLRDTEWSDSGNGKEYTFTGMASVFNSWSELLWTPKGSFKERFLLGSFDHVLQNVNPDVRFLKNHDKNLVLARTKPGTLKLRQVDDGLEVWARVAKTTYATDLKLSMERGDIDQMSLNFEMDYDTGAEDRWYEDPKTGIICHDVISVSDLFDVSVVTFPAYTETTAAMRDIERAQSRGVLVPRNVTELQPRSYKRCRQLVMGTPWAIKEEYLNLIMTIIDERVHGYRPSKEEIQERIGLKRDNEPTTEGSVAVIPLVGPIFARAGAMSDLSGAKSLEDFKGEFRAALNNPDVQSIVLDINSPGGTVDGVPEMAAEIFAARGQKPITAVANYMAASAAYWIATAADELVVSPSAEVGSVGVYAAHQDRSGQMKKMGVANEYIYAGDNKVEGNPYEPLSEEARAHLQEQIDGIYNEFVAAVGVHRNVSQADVLDNFGQGRTYLAREAVARGMADRVATLDQVVAELTPPASETRDAGVKVEFVDALEQDMSGFLSTEDMRLYLGLPALTSVTQVETDPAGTSAVTQAETDPVGDTEALAVTTAETNPLGGDDVLANLKALSKLRLQGAREDRIRLNKEMLQ